MLRKVVLFLFLVGLTLESCTNKKSDPPTVSDATLYQKSLELTSFSYFRNSHDTLVTNPFSPHGFYMRVRFNATARAAMNDSISRLSAEAFPDESMIVKEVYDIPGGPLKAYAIMFKMKNNAENAGGWLWNETDPQGNVLYSVTKRGDECISCHSTNASNADQEMTQFFH